MKPTHTVLSFAATLLLLLLPCVATAEASQQKQPVKRTTLQPRAVNRIVAPVQLLKPRGVNRITSPMQPLNHRGASLDNIYVYRSTAHIFHNTTLWWMQVVQDWSPSEIDDEVKQELLDAFPVLMKRYHNAILFDGDVPERLILDEPE